MDQMIKTQHTNRVNETPNMPNKGLLGLLGPFSGIQKIREEFSRLNIETTRSFLTDLGDVSGSSAEDICTILRAYDTKQPVISIFPSRATQDIPQSYWDSTVNPVIISNRPLDQAEYVAQIGIQKHFFSSDFEFNNRRHLRLGDIRGNSEKAEVLLRTADAIVIDLSVLRLADNIGSATSSTAGLMIEELCMIAKYAGASINLRNIIIRGYDQNNDQYNMMAKNIALLLFYILDGFKIRQSEKVQSEQLQRYSVLPDHASEEMVFIEDQRSGRWWIELYSDAAEEKVKMPCTRKDYQDACDNHISDRITSLLALA